jgi:arylsulfatase A-like enzyme
MKNSIGKPYEGKLHVRFDEGGADSLLKFITFTRDNLSGLSGSTLRGNKQKTLLLETKPRSSNFIEFWKELIRMKKLKTYYMKNSFKILMVGLLTIFISCQSNTQMTNEAKKPNILLILADDMGYGDIGAFGSEIETPNIDKLASQGMSFTNFHVGAACAPTRTMLMTGVDNHRAGMGNMLEIQADNQFGKPGYEGHLNDKVVTVATRLKDAGYHTYMAGKWHLGKSPTTIPYAKGFERSFALMESGADNYVDQPYSALYEKVHYFEDDKAVSLPTENYFSTSYYTDKIIDYISSKQEDGKPFFAYVAYQAVHYPLQAPKEFIDKYNGVYDKGWHELRKARIARQKELGITSQEAVLKTNYDATTRDYWKIPDWESLSEEEKAFSARSMQTYAGMLDNMDVNIGRIIAYLKEIGEYENTLIIFMSDNGADPSTQPFFPGFKPWYEAHYEYTYLEDYNGDFSKMGQKGSFVDFGPGWAAVSNTPNSYYKSFSTEGGLRVPFIASYPGVIPVGKQINTFVFVKDIAPTLIEIAGGDYKSDNYNGKAIHPITGASMLKTLKGEAEKVHPETEKIGYELAGNSAIFMGKYKMVKNLPPQGKGEWELYNIETDPSEMHNLVEEMPELAEELIAAYEEYETQNGVVPVPPGYDPQVQSVKNAKSGKSAH